MRIPTDLKRGLKAFPTEGELATALGVTTQTIWRWKHGDTIPPTAQKLLRHIVEEAVRRG